MSYAGPKITCPRVFRCTALFACVASAWSPAHAATIAVNTLDTSFSSSTHCSITRAVSYINAGEPTDNHDFCTAVGAYGVDDKITFDLGSGTPTILVTRSGTAFLEIPDLTKPMTIDGATGGASRVVLAGGSGVTLPGLRVRASNVQIRNLVMHSFPLAQIDIGAVSNVTIQGNFLGTDSSGLLPTFANKNGIRIIGGSDVLIGGTDAPSRNVISGNALSGIYIGNHADTVRIFGNYIGVGSDGVTPFGNCGDGTSPICAGITLQEGTHDVAIGSATTGAGNVIAANHGNGVFIAGSGTLGDDPFNTTIEGNLIGVGADGSTPIGNGGSPFNNDCGIRLLLNTDIVSSSIGGPAPGSGNIIANNAYCGVLVSGTSFVSIEANRQYANGVMGTDLSTSNAGDGPTDNDANGHLSGANLFQDFPVLTDAVGTPGNLLYVSGTLESPNTPNQASVRIDVFANRAGENQGRDYLGAFYISTDSLGSGKFMNQGPFQVPAGSPDISVTATTEVGTSEMSMTLTATSSSDVIFANGFDSK